MGESKGERREARRRAGKKVGIHNLSESLALSRQKESRRHFNEFPLEWNVVCYSRSWRLSFESLIRKEALIVSPSPRPPDFSAIVMTILLLLN